MTSRPLVIALAAVRFGVSVPFKRPRLTPEMKRQTDQLALVSRFSFTRDHRLQTELTGP
mgnify:CR=1 FL=1